MTDAEWQAWFDARPERMAALSVWHAGSPAAEQVRFIIELIEPELLALRAQIQHLEESRSKRK